MMLHLSFYYASLPELVRIYEAGALTQSAWINVFAPKIKLGVVLHLSFSNSFQKGKFSWPSWRHQGKI